MCIFSKKYIRTSKSLRWWPYCMGCRPSCVNIFFPRILANLVCSICIERDKVASLFRDMVRTNQVYNNDYQGRINQKFKFYDPQGRGSCVTCCGHPFKGWSCSLWLNLTCMIMRETRKASSLAIARQYKFLIYWSLHLNWGVAK